MIMRLVGLSLLGALVACQQESVEVRGAATNDYNYGALKKTIDKFVDAKRTPPAYQEMWQTVLKLRPGMDKATAQQAELSLVVLSLAPIQAVKDRPMAEQIETLALTVWPILLAEKIEADEIIRKRDPKHDEILPTKDETAGAYIQRLCGKQLAADCKQIVPELQGSIISALATRKGTERARNAVAECMLCTAEPGWKKAVTEWETLDHAVNEWIFETERRADPANWPIAGAASQPDPGLPEAEVVSTGEIVIGGQRYAQLFTDYLEGMRNRSGVSDVAVIRPCPV